MNIRKLRKQAPAWEWSAERFGMGWQYVGTRNGKSVRVYAVGIVGEFEDIFLEWRVDDGMKSHMYALWISSEYQQ